MDDPPRRGRALETIALMLAPFALVVLKLLQVRREAHLGSRPSPRQSD
jgi:hypothetical protein